MLHLCVSHAATARLAEALRFVRDFLPSREVLIVGATREAADEFTRSLVDDGHATFGIHRLTLFQLAVRLATPVLAAQQRTPATSLALQAVITRAARDSASAGELPYLERIAGSPGFPRAALATLSELRHAAVRPGELEAIVPSGPDLSRIARRFDEELQDAGLVDRASVIESAVATLDTGEPFCAGWPLVLLDVPVASVLDAALVAALARRSSAMFVTVPAGDDRAIDLLAGLGALRTPAAERPAAALTRVQARLFQPSGGEGAGFGEREEQTGSTGDTDPGQGWLFDAATGCEESDVEFFSAPGEGREAIEIARRLLAHAREGVPFDRMAVVLRSPFEYAPLLENACRRAGVPVWFARGTAVPDPAGRAFLALLACAAERLSARRFAEYLALGQVPAGRRDDEPADTWEPGEDEVMPDGNADDDESIDAGREHPDAGTETANGPIRAGSLRTPWRWEHLLVEAAVAGRVDRWRRRLDGLAQELRSRRAEQAKEDPEAPVLDRLDRDLEQLGHLRSFALPIVERLAAWPARAVWDDWLARLEELAGQVLKRPQRVLGVLADLRPLGGPPRQGAKAGPVDLDEVRRVLGDRLGELYDQPAARRSCEVFVGLPHDIRGRAFDIVFVPGLAERVFPKRPRQDPLLLDEARIQLTRSLSLQDDRIRDERLLLSIAVGAASRRVCLSYPRMQMVESRPRVPSFYAIDVERARTGAVPDVGQLIRRAERAAGARLAWPAPADPASAIDDIEHDLSVLRRLLDARDVEARRGRARYLFDLNDALAQSLRRRWMRQSQSRWTPYDGFKARDDEGRALLQRHRLRARPYSVSALQKYAACPYRFFLSAIQKLEPRQDRLQLDRLDPQTRGHIFHRVQAETVHALRERKLLPIAQATLAAALEALAETLARVADDEHDRLVPAIDRVWHAEIESMGADLRAWLQHVAEEGGVWQPALVEFGFGFSPGGGRDPASIADPVTLDGGWQLHGVVDLIEGRTDARYVDLRVTDHKTGRPRAKAGFVVGEGQVLQPILYAMAIEQCLGRPVSTSRLFYCTAAGRFTIEPAQLDAPARRRATEVLEIVDRSIEQGFLPPAPGKDACKYCDFRTVCGPGEERQAARKDRGALADLIELRGMK